MYRSNTMNNTSKAVSNASVDPDIDGMQLETDGLNSRDLTENEKPSHMLAP
jgi:hypothetical protein